MRKGGGKVNGIKVLAFAVGLGCAAPAGSAEPAAAVDIPHATDLYADGRTARERGIPILLMFASETCSYCLQVEQDYLEPMLRSGEYADKLIIRKLLIRDPRTLADFDGTDREAAEISRRYGVDLVPTLVFVDAHGRELGERLVGLTTVDFYWGYLERSMELARDQLHAAAP
ncbi:MAG TPA: thioredoxin fold domain-containing protein [Gammaproteobacteria bacterium]